MLARMVPNGLAMATPNVLIINIVIEPKDILSWKRARSSIEFRRLKGRKVVKKSDNVYSITRQSDLTFLPKLANKTACVHLLLLSSALKNQQQQSVCKKRK